MAMQTNSILGYTPAFGISQYRRKNGLYSYKLGRNSQHKNPHSLNLKSKMYMKKQGYKGELKIQERERLSDRPFGQHTTKGKFRFNIEKVPFYNVPDITGFKLKPYVPHITPKISDEKYVEKQVLIDSKLLERIEQQIEDSSKGKLEARDGYDGMNKCQSRIRWN